MICYSKEGGSLLLDCRGERRSCLLTRGSYECRGWNPGERRGLDKNRGERNKNIQLRQGQARKP